MFDGLRKKLSEAVRGFIKKEEKKEPERKEEETVEEEQVEESTEVAVPETEEKEPESTTTEPIVQEVEEDKGKETTEVAVAVENKEEKKEVKAEPERKKGKKKENEIIKLSLKTKIKGAILHNIRLSESEIDGFLDSVKISMLESDVSYDTTESFIEDLHSRLKEKQIDSRRIRREITDTVRGSLFSVLYKGKVVDIDNFVTEKKKSGELPVKILFLGPNGAGKTTTIAKIAHRFKNEEISNVLSASDTFRAAAIEQIEHHANKIGVPVIKSTYGADPASIAFDSIAYARAHGVDAVLIDSAGRQETNKNLISEIQKMVRVAKPDLTIFIGESTAGNVIANQIKEFNKFVKIDGIILTKLDCDAKGGGALSISHLTGIPILFFGTGESYDNLVPYNPNYIVDAILPENN